ncbi:hypothetical protein [Vibrio rarus]|nr:hypothetical protein [Vibrio rarus]
MMKRFIIVLFMPFMVQGHDLHFSPHITVGPMYGTGISGYGGQLGITNVFGNNTLYASVEQIEYRYFTDEERWNTYRIGIQHPLKYEPRVQFQFELGSIDYTGSRDLAWDLQSRSGHGISSSTAVVFKFNSYFAVRGGISLNYVDHKNTFLPYSVFGNIDLGIVLNTNFNGH